MKNPANIPDRFSNKKINRSYHYLLSRWLIIGLCISFVIGTQIVYAESPAKNKAAVKRQFTFSWPFSDGDKLRPRGGTSIGKPVTLFSGTSRQWESIQGTKSNKKKKARLAILALAGDYRVSFDFIETMGFQSDYEVPAPYQSWGTERISVLVNKPDFVVLQHILEIHLADIDGKAIEPVIVKHWRQDWRYEDDQSLDYIGKREWKKTAREKDQISGRWSQSVFQVDDSPRYEGIGKWTHHTDMSVWTSDVLKRPLPRREFSVRNDYDFLKSRIRITVIPTGWIQEEDALKVSMNGKENQGTNPPLHLAREAGLSRYELITDFDFSRADAYWERTSKFWNSVRDVWERIIAERTSFYLVSERDGKYLFAQLFGAAEESKDLNDADTRAYIRSVIDQYLD